MGDAQSVDGEVAARGRQFRPPGGRYERWQQLGATIWICLPATALDSNSRRLWNLLQHAGERISPIPAPPPTSVRAQLLRHCRSILGDSYARAGRITANPTGRL